MNITLTQNERDALLFACDLNVEDAHDDEPSTTAIFRMPVVAALIDDLVLANAEGRYEIRSLPRDTLVEFLEHELAMALESGLEPPFLRLWHTSARLLDELGHKPNGSIYEKVECGCTCCVQERERRDRLYASLEQAASDEERIDIIRSRDDEDETTLAEPAPRPQLQFLRNAAGMTREQLADRIGVPQATVDRWERGVEPIPDEHALTLAELFAISVPFLLGENLKEEDA